jgi:hypothetical protein
MFIIDNAFLSKKEIGHYQNIILSNNEIDWSFLKSAPEKSLSSKTLPGPNTENNFQLVHIAYPTKNKESKILKDLEDLLKKFTDKNNINIGNIERIKINIISNKEKILNQTNVPHIDSVSPFVKSHSKERHLVFLYYVNDSDGPTIIYNEKYPLDNYAELSIRDTIKPTEGKGILFEGDQYHSSSSPIESNVRCIININFTGWEKND